MNFQEINKLRTITILTFVFYLFIALGVAFAQTAEDYFQQGKAGLENQDLLTAHSNFQFALSLDPNHQGANLFYALTRLLMISKSPDFHNLLDRAGVSSSGRDILNWTADFMRDAQGRIIFPPGSPTGVELQAFLKNNIFPEVDNALNNLTKVSNSYETNYRWIFETGSGLVNTPNTLTETTKYWGYNELVGCKIVIEGTEYTITSNNYNTITVSPNWTIPSGTYNYKISEPVEIDYGDVLVMKGSLYLARTTILILSAYNLNIDIDTIVSLCNAGSLNIQTHIIDTYPQLLQLLTEQQLSQAKVYLKEAISIFNSAIDFTVGEIDPQNNDLLIIETSEDEQQYRNLLADLNNALDGIAYIRELEEYVNLSDFFDRPKALRNYLPVFRGQKFIQVDSFPDATFGGILPYMTLNELNQILKDKGLLVIFSDFPPGYWAEDYINAIFNAGITTGCAQDDPNTPENERQYCSESNVTREQMAAFIVRAVGGEPPSNYCDSGTAFPDVTADMWSCKYIKKLRELGITTGYQDGTYGPYDTVPREQMAAFIVRAKEGEPPSNYCDSGTPFPDVSSSMWSCRYIKRLKELGITTGYQNGTYGPYDLVTRAQMAAFLSRAFLGMP